jgi:alpha-glucosidase
MRLRTPSRVVLASAALLLALPAARAQAPLTVASPDGRNVVTISVRDGGLFYAVDRGARHIMLPSRLGFEFRGARALRDSLSIAGSSRSSYDTTWVQPWGEVARVRDQHNELRVEVAESAAPRRRFAVVARAFDDGVAFRYELPAEGFGDFEMTEELTEFSLADDAKAWWIPANKPQPDRYEELFASSPVSRIDTVHTPLTLEMQNGTRVVIHEANLVDYAGMNLAGRYEGRTLHAALASSPTGSPTWFPRCWASSSTRPPAS